MTYLPSQPNATLIDAFKADPDIADPLHHFAQALMRGPSPFTPAERELIAIHVSQANGCAFCRDSHAAGWDEAAVRHAALVCGFFNLMNRWVEGLGIESDAQTVALAGRMLAGEGYAAVSKFLRS